jgi:hypothetical protein
MVIGIVAALAVLAAALTTLTVNARHNTSRDRQQTRSFAAAEAALDDGLARLARLWPETEDLAPTFDAAAEDAFKTRYIDDGNSGEYPIFSVAEWYYDDQDANGDEAINVDDYAFDQNQNDRMYVETQVLVGARTTRLRALVQRETISFGIPRGTAFYTDGDLRTNGGSVVIGIDAGGAPSDAAVIVSGMIGGIYDNDGSSNYSEDVTVFVRSGNTEGNTVPNVLYDQPVPGTEEKLNPRILDYLKLVASPDNYYTEPSDVSDHYIAPTPENPDPDDLTGLVFIESTDLARFQVHGTFNSVDSPGILVVRGGSLEFTGGGDYYGIIFVDGGATDLGNVKVHGAVICAGGADSQLGGSQTILYNDRIWMNLNQEITLAAKIVPNSWREVSPVTVAP